MVRIVVGRPPRYAPAIMGGNVLRSDVVFSRASTAYYSNTSLPPAGVDVPRYQTGSTGYVFSPDDIRTADVSAAIASNTAGDRSLAGYQPLIDGLNVVLVYGQSNAAGTQAFPPQRVTPVSGLYMLGDSTRGTAATTHTPIGTAVLKPMIANVLNTARTTVLDPAAIAALDYSTDNNLGETNADTATMRLRQRMLADAANDAREIVVLNCAEPGTPAANLTRGAPANWFNRIPTGIAQLAALAASAGKDIRVVAVVYHQGEADCGIVSAAAWRTSVESIMDDILPYAISPSIPAQTRPPLPFIVQIGSLGVIGNDDLTIPQATLAMAQARGWPIVPRIGTDKGLHMDVNGAGETGIPLSRAMYRALVQRRGTIDVAPHVASCRASGNELLLTFTAPASMRSRPYYAGWTATTHSGLGARLIDSTGALTVVSASFVGARTVRYVCNRAFTGGSVNVGIGYRNHSAGANNFNVDNVENTGFLYAYSADMNPLANVPARNNQELDQGDFATLSTFDQVVT